MKNSDNIVLAEQANLCLEGEEPNEKIVVKNDLGGAVLIFPKNAVSDRTQHEDDPTKIDLYIDSKTRRRVLYKFDFSTRAQATALIARLD